jgi:hypothetical protein
MANIPWYRQYKQLREEVLAAKQEYENRCKKLAAPPNRVFLEIRREFIARIVHESNWQEGMYLDEPRTQELTEAIFRKFCRIIGPHINMEDIVVAYQADILKDRKAGMSVEELAAENLSFAHFMLEHVGFELALRQIAGQEKQILQLNKELAVVRGKLGIQGRSEEAAPSEMRDHLMSISTSHFLDSRFYAPLTESVETNYELIREYMRLDTNELLHPMRIQYIHFLHKITMMGILPATKRGVFRRGAVNVGDPDVFFPPPSTIPGLMENYCQTFPTQVDVAQGADVIRKAAEASYNFVRIHPYVDGNGRISRLLMNLVLMGRFPPVYLKADKKVDINMRKL